MELNLQDLLDMLVDTGANYQLADPSLLQHYVDKKTRTVRVYGEIEVGFAREVIQSLAEWNEEDAGKPIEERKCIKFWIDNAGGLVSELLSVIKAIELSETPVKTICVCMAASAAADLLACGHPGLRYAMPGTTIMMHAGSCKYEGTQSQVEDTKKYFDTLGKRVTDHVYERTNLSPKIKKRLKDHDYYMDENEALELGIIDHIVTSFKDLD